MKTLYESIIYEGILSNMEDTLVDGDNKAAEMIVNEAIRKDYKLKAERKNKLTIIGKTPDGKYLVNYTGDVDVKNKDLTTLENELFQWNEVSGTFTCFKINKLKDLKGSPKSVSGFNCNQCKGLESLEGAPEKMTMGNSLTGNGFYCIECTNLKTLKGAPETVWGGFYCGYCTKLTSLEGAPKRIVGDFNCHDTNIKTINHVFDSVTDEFDLRNCKYLTTLKGLPTKIGNKLVLVGCNSLNLLKLDWQPKVINGTVHLSIGNLSEEEQEKVTKFFDSVISNHSFSSNVKWYL
jgi:hypothetical protein